MVHHRADLELRECGVLEAAMLRAGRGGEGSEGELDLGDELDLGRSARRVLHECAGHCLIVASTNVFMPPKPRRQYAKQQAP